MNQNRIRGLSKLLGFLGVTAVAMFLVSKAAGLMRKRRTSQVDRLPPGSMGLPFIGETLSYIKNTHRFFETRFTKHGPVFKTSILGKPVVCFTGSEAFTFFATKPYFNREGANPRHVQELFSWRSLPLIEGDDHLKMRNLVLQAFRHEALDIYVQNIHDVTLSYLQRWEHDVDFAWVSEYKKMSASICDSLFNGAETGVSNDRFAQVLDSFIAGVTALPITLPWTKYGRALRSRNKLLSHIDNAISSHRQRPFEDILTELLAAESEDGTQFSQEQLRAVIVHMYFAAYGNIFRVLTLLCMNLAQNPEVMERAREEVLKHTPEGPLDLELLGRLSFLDQVTREVRRHNRIFASTFFDWVTEPFEFHGYHVPKGWKAVGCIYTTMQDANVFSNPDQFDPDRFGPDRAEDHRKENSYIPQGGGPMEGHRCPAEDLTTLLMKVVGVLLLRRYNWKMPPQDLSLNDESSPLPRDGLKVKFVRR